MERDIASLRPEELTELLQALTPQPSAISLEEAAVTPMSNRVYDEATLLQAVALANAAASLQQQNSEAQMDLPLLFPALSGMSQAGLLDLLQRSTSQVQLVPELRVSSADSGPHSCMQHIFFHLLPGKEKHQKWHPAGHLSPLHLTDYHLQYTYLSCRYLTRYSNMLWRVLGRLRCLLRCSRELRAAPRLPALDREPLATGSRSAQPKPSEGAVLDCAPSR